MMEKNNNNKLLIELLGSRIALRATSILVRQPLQHRAKCPTYEPGAYMIKSISVQLQV